MDLFTLIITLIICVVVLVVIVLVACCCRHRNQASKKEAIYHKLESVYTDNSYDNPQIVNERQEFTVSRSENNNCKQVCEYCGTKFKTASALRNHHRNTYFARCRYKKYKQVKEDDNAINFIKERFSQAVLHKDMYHKCKDVVIDVLTKMLSHRSNCSRFNNKVDREGSTKTGLKTRKPVEFDFSVEVLLRETPEFIFEDDNEQEFNDDSIGENSSTEQTPPGSVKVKLKYTDAKRFSDCCKDGLLSPSKLKKTFHNFISGAKNIGTKGVKVTVCRTTNGPAVRLIIEHTDIPHKIDVDLTPKITLPAMIHLHGFDWPRDDTRRFLTDYDINSVNSNALYLVPKKEDYWLVSFANYENAVLRMFQNDSVEKNVLRCTKVRLEAWRTQSPAEMKPISSFILKEAFLWLRESLPEKHLWNMDNCADRYCNFIEELKFRFKYKHLQDYFCPDTDLMTGKEIARNAMMEYLDEELELVRGTQ